MIAHSVSFGLLIIRRMLSLLCPGITFTLRFRIAGLRIRDTKLYDAPLAKGLSQASFLRICCTVLVVEVLFVDMDSTTLLTKEQASSKVCGPWACQSSSLL